MKPIILNNIENNYGPSDIVPITSGGTGAATVEEAKINLGLDNLELPDTIKEKDLVVELVSGSTRKVTHTVTEIKEAYENGRTV